MTTPSQSIAHAMQHSRHFKHLLESRPWLQEQLQETLDRALTRVDLQAFLNASPAADESGLSRRLRELKAWAASHALVRDLSGIASLTEVTRTMSLIAEVSLAAAQTSLHAQLVALHGQPRSADGRALEMIVVGMGKLGGMELNVSSDIDLIFIYPEDGETDGPRQIGNFDFFTRLGRALIRVLSELTGDGYVFRVDMRLRPNGDSGPLVASFDMLENYFITQGREWERYAWIKARALTGDRHDELQSIVRPFVFRKYLDFGAINAMRALHARIRKEVERRDRHDNIKLGPGGIREIEFIAQVFQLIRGGGDHSLQIRPTLAVLEILEQHGLLDTQTVRELTDAYIFLRKLEHRIQYLDDAQTHSLPADGKDRESLARTMGLADAAALLHTLDGFRQNVCRHFSAVFADPEATEPPLLSVWMNASESGPTSASLGELGYRYPHDSSELLNGFRTGSRVRTMNNEARQRLDAVMPRILALAARRANPDDTLARMINLLEAICRRSAYLALLQQYPQALSRVIELVSSSRWAAGYVTQHPILLDELLDNRLNADEPDWAALAQELAASMDTLGDDMERQMDVMREWHHAQVFHLLNQDLMGQLSVEHLSDHLSALADTILEETLRQTWKRSHRHLNEHHYAILGYGKLGGKELGYASDLDLVFIHDDPDPDSQLIYSRLSQRITTWLDSHTGAGQLFEIDTRLRPNGAAGLIVVSLEAFEQYQRREAWVWEHQALTRARFCAGDRKLGEKFEKLRIELLGQPREIPALRAEILSMRQKMRLNSAGKSDGFNLKHDTGGLIDVEFIVQFLVLAYAHKHPKLVGNKGNIALLGMAAEAGLIPAGLASSVADAYRIMRHAQHGLRLNEAGNVSHEEYLDEVRLPVQELWQQVFGVVIDDPEALQRP